MVFVSFFEQYKKYSSCLISFLSFSELFPACNCAKNIANLLSIWSDVNIFSLCTAWFLLCSADFSLSKLRISVMSGCSSSDFFCLLIFVLSAILSWNSGSNSDPDSGLNFYSDSHPGSGSDWALYGKSLGLIFLFSNKLMILFLLLYRFISFKKTLCLFFKISSLKIFGQKIFIPFYRFCLLSWIFFCYI